MTKTSNPFDMGQTIAVFSGPEAVRCTSDSSRHLSYKCPEVGRPVVRPFEEHSIVTQFMTTGSLIPSISLTPTSNRGNSSVAQHSEARSDWL